MSRSALDEIRSSIDRQCESPWSPTSAENMAPNKQVCNYDTIVYRFQHIARYWPKIVNFSYICELNTHRGGSP